MKKIHFCLLILILFVIAGSLPAQTSITLTFTAVTGGQYQVLDSVLVINHTRGCDTVLYYPDTVLVLENNTSVSDPFTTVNEGLILYPSFPNPSAGHTTTRFFLPESDRVTIRAYDLSGREVSVYEQLLPAGEHTFTLYPGGEKNYLLVVETPRHKRAQKLVSMDGGNAFRIVHSGHQPGLSGFRYGKSGLLWAPGDQLQFTGYAMHPSNIIVGRVILDDPSSSSLHTFSFVSELYPVGTVHCDTVNLTAVIDVYNPATGRIWMDRNLGASRVAEAPADVNAYGDIYQWGRFADGHQCRTSTITPALSSNDLPGHGNFIVNISYPYDWRSPQNHSLWQGVNGVNNPCPAGYRLPTEAELADERAGWSSNNTAGAFESPLKLTLAGLRSTSTGTFVDLGNRGIYWSSNVTSHRSQAMYFHNTLASSFSRDRVDGHSVRCIKDN